MMRATFCATTAIMTLDMVLEVVLALAHNYSHPVPHTRYTLDASHAHADTPSPPCKECPQALERACYLGKVCQWPTLRLTPGAHPCSLPDVAHRKAHECLSFYATSALLGHSAPSRLVEEPSSTRVSILPWKNMQVANVAAHLERLTHASHPMLPIERHTDAPPPL